MNNFELGILDWIQNTFRCGPLDIFMPFITKFGDAGIFWICVAVVMLCFKKTRKAGLSVGFALLLGLIFGNGLLKNLVARIRPYDLNPTVTLLVKKLSDFSFPSGHTLASFEAATALMKRDKRFGVPALVLAVMIALSRLYLYVHYPSDVLVGALLGICFGLIGCMLADFVYRKLAEKKQVH